MPAKKKVAALVKVALNAGAATPAPPVGTALGPHGVNIMEFCKQYNAATEAMRGTIIPVEITIFEDRIVHLHHEDPAGRRAHQEGRQPQVRLRDPSQCQGRQDHARPGPRDRGDQDAGPQCERHRGRHEDRRGHCPQHGRHRRVTLPADVVRRPHPVVGPARPVRTTPGTPSYETADERNQT